MNTSSRVYSYAQRGMATLAILILVGFAVSVAVFGALRFLQGSQSQTTAYHSQTQAQMKAWAGVDLVSQYLSSASEQLDSSEKFNSLLSALITQSNILGQLNDNNLSAVITNISPAAYDPNIESYKITANITGLSSKDTRAEASSTIEVIYQLTVAKTEIPPTVAPPGNNVISFHDDVDLTGGITLKGQSQETYEIVVRGNVKLGRIGLDQSFDGLSISSTGSIEFNGGGCNGGGCINLKKLHANCDIKLTSGPSATEILATNNICISGSQDSPNNIIKANGSVNLKGKYGDIEASANKPVNTAMCDVAAIRKCDDVIKVVGVEVGDGSTVKTISTKGNVKITGSVSGYIQSDGNVDNPKWAGPFGHITARGDVSLAGNTAGNVIIGGTFNAGQTTVKNISIKGDLITGYNFDTTGGQVGGKYTHTGIPACNGANPDWCFGPGNSNYKSNVAVGVANVPIPSPLNLTPVPPVVIKQTIFSVDIYRSIANYVFYHSGNNNMVLVQDVTGIPNGSYYLHQGQIGSAPYNDWLCSKPIGQATAADCIAKIGRGNKQNTLISYSAEGWELKGDKNEDSPRLAPGIAYFEGDLTLNTGKYHNTFISTKNIKISDDVIVKSPNYVGYQGVCNTDYGIKPTSLCLNNTYNSNAYSSIGNFALMAGVCTARNGEQCTAYTGGDITTGGSTTVEGSILAGNRFFSGGNTVVKGYVTAFVQRTPTSGSSLGGSTAIDVSNLPSTYIPSGNAPSVDGSGNGAASFSVSSRVLWARYL